MSHSTGESFDKSDRVDDKDSKWNVEVGDTRHSRGGDRAFYTVTEVYLSFTHFFSQMDVYLLSYPLFGTTLVQQSNEHPLQHFAPKPIGSKQFMWRCYLHTL